MDELEEKLIRLFTCLLSGSTIGTDRWKYDKTCQFALWMLSRLRESHPSLRWFCRRAVKSLVRKVACAQFFVNRR